MEIENILKKSCNFCIVYRESRTRSSDNSISIDPPQQFGHEMLSVCSKLKIIILGRRQTIFPTLYFQFEKKFDFLIFCVCLPGIMENRVNDHGKVKEFYYQISDRQPNFI